MKSLGNWKRPLPEHLVRLLLSEKGNRGWERGVTK